MENKSKYLIFLVIFFALEAFTRSSSELIELSDEIFYSSEKPQEFLETLGNKLLFLGNTDFHNAEYVLLPEIHSDDFSLMLQIIMLSLEKKRGHDFIVLDESIDSYTKSSWELFTQKTLEVIAALEEKRLNKSYSVRSFEAQLQKLTHLFRDSSKNTLTYIEKKGVWSLPKFTSKATAFFGWDDRSTYSMVKRNQSMVKTLSKLKHKKRKFIMLGARHVPYFDYLIGRKLLCNGQIKEPEFFNRIIRSPKIINNFRIGTSYPIYQYLKNKKFVIVTTKDFVTQVENIALNKKANQRCVPF